MRRAAYRRWILVPLVLLVMSSSWGLACQVPVFRYALERWLSDQYEILVLHDGPLGAAEQASLSQLSREVERACNATVRAIDAPQSKAPLHQELWKQHGKAGSALMTILYPASAREIPQRFMYATTFDASSTKHVVDSPVRQQIAKRLAGGQSAVWIFVPIGIPEKDAPAHRVLESELARCQKELKLPPPEEIDIENGTAKIMENVLRLEFSSVTLDRNDPAEALLLRMLIGSEEDLASLEEPLAFPVFGRGRVLYALVGKGINGDMIHRACQFMVGPCSCQVKAQNPGFDLLMSHDWEKAVGEDKISDPLPDEPAAPVLLTIPPGRKAKP